MRLFLFSPFERMVAMRYLRPKRREGFISVIAGFSFLGILLGVATLIIVMSVMNGFRHELMGKILGFNGHIVVSGQGVPLGRYEDIAKAIRGIPGVVTATPTIDGQVLATANDFNAGVIVRGLSKEDFRRNKLVSAKIDPTVVDRFEGDDGIIIGHRMARNFGLRVGDRLSLISPKGNTTPFGVVPRTKAYRVVATFDVGMAEYDRSFVFMPLEEAQRYFSLPDAVSSIEVMTANPDGSHLVIREIAKLPYPNLRITDWRDTNTTFFNALQVERSVMFMILTLIIIVAAFNIVSSLIMLVKDKVQAIAIMRTMGATRWAVMRIFFLSGASIGVVGTLAGVALGLVFCDNINVIKGWLESLSGRELFAAEIYFLSRLPAIVDMREVYLIGGMSLGLTFLATVYPSWRAARLDPVEALRNE